MAWRRNRGLDPEQRRDLWRRWRKGQTLTEIGEALGKQPGSVFGAIRACGGYSPRERMRGGIHQTRSDREEITRGLAAGHSLRSASSASGFVRTFALIGWWSRWARATSRLAHQPRLSTDPR
jgi:hypothetical protein